MDLTHPPCPSSSSSPAAASRPFPHFARWVPYECQAGIQGFCRCASLAGSVGAAAGRPWCLDSIPSPQHKHAVLIGWSRPVPPPLLNWTRRSHIKPTLGGLWRAVTCGMPSLVFLHFSVTICHSGVYSRSIHPSMSGSCTDAQSQLIKTLLAVWISALPNRTCLVWGTTSTQSRLLQRWVLTILKTICTRCSFSQNILEWEAGLDVNPLMV